MTIKGDDPFAGLLPTLQDDDSTGILDRIFGKEEEPTADPFAGLLPSIDDTAADPFAAFLPQIEERGIGETFTDAFARGTYQSGASVANLFGDEELADLWREKASLYERDVASFQDVLLAAEADGKLEALKEFGIYATEGLGEVAPQLAATLAATVGGTLVGGPVGGFAGATAVTAPLSFGESKEQVQAEGLEGTLDEYIVQGTLKTGLDMLNVFRIGDKFGLNNVVGKHTNDFFNNVFKKTPDSLLGRVTKEAGVTGFTEAVTEFAQTGIDIIGTNILTDKDVLALQPKQKWELIDSLILGGMTGNAVGAVVGGLSKPTPKQRQQTPSETVETSENKQRIDNGIDSVSKTVETEIIRFNELNQAIIDTPEGNPLSPQFAGVVAEDQVPYLYNPEMASIRNDMTSSHNINYLIQPVDGEPNVKVSNVKDRVISSGMMDITSSAESQVMVDTVQGWVDKLMPGKKITLIGKNLYNSMTTRIEESDTLVAGSAIPVVDGTAIYVNIPYISAKVQVQNPNVDPQTISDLTQAEIYETLAHEFGHAMVIDMFDQSAPDVKAGVMNAYWNWVESNKSLTEEQFLEQYHEPISLVGADAELRQTYIDEFNSNPTYYLSFEEFIARQMAKYMSKDARTKQEFVAHKPFWDRAMTKLKDLFNMLKNDYGLDKTAQAWIESFRVKEQIRQLAIQQEAENNTLSKRVMRDIQKERQQEAKEEPQVPETFFPESTPPMEGTQPSNTMSLYIPESQAKASVKYGYAYKGVTAYGKTSKGKSLRPTGHIGKYRFGIAKLYNTQEGLRDRRMVLDYVMKVDPDLYKYLLELNNVPIDEMFEGLSPEKRNVFQNILRSQFGVDGFYTNIKDRTEFFITNPDILFKEETTINGRFVANSVATQTLRDMGANSNIQRAYQANEQRTKRWYWLMEHPVYRPILMTVMNIRQLAQRFQETPIRNAIQPLRDFVTAVRDWANEKQTHISNADQVVQNWKGLGSTESNQLSRYLFELTLESDKLERKLSDAEKQALWTKVNQDPLTPEILEVFNEIQESFRFSLNGMELAVISKRLRQLGYDRVTTDDFIQFYRAQLDLPESTPESRQEALIRYVESDGTPVTDSFIKALDEIRASFDMMRNRDYFPMMRFGKYVVNIRTQKEDGTWGINEDHEHTGFYTFDTFKQKKAFMKEMEKKLSTHAIPHRVTSSVKLDDLTAQLVNMPSVFIDRVVETMRDAGVFETLTPEQKEFIEQLKLEKGPGSAMMKHLNRRGGVKGYNEDAMRTFSAYQVTAANNIARVTHGEKMFLQINILREDAAQLDKEEGVSVEALSNIIDYMQEHFKYIHNPANDMARLRQFGFLMYLGFNVKSAVVNMSQTPMITYPVFVQRAIDSGISKTKADALVLNSLKNAGAKAMLYRGSIDVNLDKMSPEKRARVEEDAYIYEQMLSRGILNQTFARHLAQEADPSAPIWFGSNQKVNEVYTWIVEKSSVFFNIAEEYNRRVAMLSALEFRRKTPEWATLSPEEKAFRIEDDILATQFDYSRENRAPLMRGPIKSNIFLFQNYLQNVLNIYTGGEGGHAQGRALVVLLAIGGVMGLPGMQDLEYILNWMYKKYYGEDNYDTFRQDVRSLSDNLFDNPETLTYGLSGRENGLLSVMDAFGIPVPEVDLTGSISMGHIIPGFRGMYNASDSPNEVTGKAVVAAGGPLAGWAYNVYRAIAEEDASTYHRVAGVMPAFARQAMSAFHLKENQGITTRKGDFLEGISADDFDSRFQYYETLGAMGLGFQPSKKTRAFERYGVLNDYETFYRLRRSRLMDDFYRAQKNGTREQKAAARKAIRVYNKTLSQDSNLAPFRINGKSLSSSVKQKRQLGQRRLLGRADRRKSQRLKDHLDDLYPGDF